jgi:hypothetical protein
MFNNAYGKSQYYQIQILPSKSKIPINTKKLLGIWKLGFTLDFEFWIWDF